MHTDASHRFERGADWGITPLACDRVAELILESAGGELVGERIDAVARSLERPPIALHRSEVKRILGIDLCEQEIEAHPWQAGLQRAPAHSSCSHRRSGGDRVGSQRLQRHHPHVAARRRARDRSAGRAGAHLRLQQVSQHAAIIRRSGDRAAQRAEGREDPRDHARARLRRSHLDHLHLRAGRAHLQHRRAAAAGQSAERRSGLHAQLAAARPARTWLATT